MLLTNYYIYIIIILENKKEVKKMEGIKKEIAKAQKMKLTFFEFLFAEFIKFFLLGLFFNLYIFSVYKIVVFLEKIL